MICSSTVGLHLVVELQVRLDPRLRRENLPPRVDEALLAGGLGGQILVVRRRLVDVRDLGGVVAQPLRQRDHAEERVVVRVQERADRQPRLVVLVLVEPLAAASIVSSAVNGSLTVPVLCLPSPCGSGPTHSEKPNSSSRSASRYFCDVFRLRLPVVVDRQQVARHRPGRRGARARHATCPCSRCGSRRRGTSHRASAPCPGRARTCRRSRRSWRSRRSA